MAGIPEGTRAVTMFVPIDKLEQVDAAAYQMRGRRNDRTTWVLKAIDEKLGVRSDDGRIEAISTAYESLNEDGKAWLHAAAQAALGYEKFKA